MKIAWLSPLPPVRSGIASYSEMLLPEIAKLVDVTAVVDQTEIDPSSACPVIGVDEYRRRRSEFDQVVCQIGNNIHHEFVWREAREHPAVLVLHELVLHHLVTEATLARGEADEFIAVLRESDGIAGEAFARGRAAGHHLEAGNFLFPASIALAASSRAIIVHNQWARARLVESGVRTPIRVVDHPLDKLKFDRDEKSEKDLREQHGFPPQSRVIGMFGFVTQPKRPHIVFEAFSRAHRAEADLRLLVVGEAATNVDLSALARRFHIPDDAWSSTGWTTDEEFDGALLGVDRVVSLRYPSAGESSGAIARVFAAGKPLAVSDYAQFAELPPDIVVRIPLGELEITSLERFMTERSDGEGIVRRQREWITAHGDPATVARDYVDVLEEANRRATDGRGRKLQSSLSTLGIMPCLSVDSFSARRRESVVSVEATITNRGTAMVRSYDWGGPAYRMIVKLMDRGREITSSWWPLPGDLEPGQTVAVSGEVRGRIGDEIHFVHGWFEAPLVDETPFFKGEVAP